MTTKEIAQNVVHASSGIQEINEGIVASYNVSGEVVKDIADVNRQAIEMSSNSQEVKSNAETLETLSIKLKNIVSIFRTDKSVSV